MLLLAQGSRLSRRTSDFRSLGPNFWNPEGRLHHVCFISKIKANLDERLMCRRIRALAANIV